jgi:hypothetical protein
MPRVGFETTISVFQWPKTFFILDRAATEIGVELLRLIKVCLNKASIIM